MSFVIEKLQAAAKQKMIETEVWQISCPVSLDDLVSLKVLHYNFSGEVKTGELIIHQKIAQNALKIFLLLKQIKFPIEQITPIENFAGDDELSMKHNNSSCFNYRTIANSKLISLHSYGLAIDLNPLQNPVITFENNIAVISPILGKDYLDRSYQRAGMVEQIIVDIFADNGLAIWGGNWKKPIDYHHFQIERSEIESFISTK